MAEHVHPGAQPHPGARSATRSSVDAVIQYGDAARGARGLDRRAALPAASSTSSTSSPQFARRPRAGGGGPDLRARLARAGGRAARLRGRPLPDLPASRSASRCWSSNAGFAGANNAGVGLARGRLLLLLNSDVLPDRPGWLGTMREFYDATPDIGALGPKLLYEDDSIQHAGMYFYQPARLADVGRRPLLQGHAPQPARRPTSRAPVPAVSGACMMIDRDAVRGARRPAAACTCRATTRTPTSACG